jgi:D-alanyl-D-alanine carboxypeptidase
VPLLSKPFTAYHDSNIGYMVAGLIAQRAGGADLASLFRSQIIDPLHLASARYDPAPNISGPHADGYVLNPNGTVRDIGTWTMGLAGDGGIVADAADEARFLQALMRGQILAPEQLSALETQDNPNGYGLGIFTQLDGCTPAGGLAFGHNGGGEGYMSSVQVSRDGSQVAVVLINGYGASNAAQDHASTVLFNTMQSLYCGG